MSGKRLFIVVIGDSPLICDVLSKEGHQVQSFSRPRMALHAILKTGKTPRPDLLLVDLSLPTMSGYEVVRLFKNNLASRHIPVIVISGFGSIIARLGAFFAGADGYLENPLDIPQIIALVQWYALPPPKDDKEQNLP